MFKKVLFWVLVAVFAVCLTVGATLLIPHFLNTPSTNTEQDSSVTEGYNSWFSQDKTFVPHAHEYKVVSTVLPSCTDGGHSVYCCSCGESYNSDHTPATGHMLNAWYSVRTATCIQEGVERRDCDNCGYYETRPVARSGHSFSKWHVLVQATPTTTGKRYKQCSHCSKKVTENYNKKMAGANSIYIPGTGIDALVTVGSFTQEDVDRYDVVFCMAKGKKLPTVLGHNTGTMKTLYNTKVGQYIYLSLNGNIKTYKVVISEPARQTSDRKNVIGLNTGTGLYNLTEFETLRLQTCYGSDANGRWMVMARPVS